MMKQCEVGYATHRSRSNRSSNEDRFGVMSLKQSRELAHSAVLILRFDRNRECGNYFKSPGDSSGVLHRPWYIFRATNNDDAARFRLRCARPSRSVFEFVTRRGARGRFPAWLDWCLARRHPVAGMGEPEPTQNYVRQRM